MRHEVYNLETPNSVAAGTAQPCEFLHEKTVQVFGTFVATVQIQARIAPPAGTTNNDWVNIGAPLMVPGLVPIADLNGNPLAVTHVRANVTAFTSGDPQAVLGGFSSRTD